LHEAGRSISCQVSVALRMIEGNLNGRGQILGQGQILRVTRPTIYLPTGYIEMSPWRIGWDGIWVGMSRTRSRSTNRWLAREVRI